MNSAKNLPGTHRDTLAQAGARIVVKPSSERDVFFVYGSNAFSTERHG